MAFFSNPTPGGVHSPRVSVGWDGGEDVSINARPMRTTNGQDETAENSDCVHTHTTSQYYCRKGLWLSRLQALSFFIFFNRQTGKRTITYVLTCDLLSFGVGAGGFRVAQFVRIGRDPSHCPFILLMAVSASCTKKKESMIIKIKSGHCRHHNNTNGIWESKQKYISVISETD